MPKDVWVGWPQWQGRAVAIVASGPSLNKADVALLKGRLPVLAIKKNVELAPWADVVYGCDYPWWRSVRGLPDFAGLKLAYADRAVTEFGCTKVAIPDVRSDRLSLDPIGSVGAAGNSGFQAFNLALQFGARRILLLGFDMQVRSGAHWYGRNGWHQANNPSESQVTRWAAAFNAAGPDVEQIGAEVVNASQITAIRAFPKRGVADTLQAWGL